MSEVVKKRRGRWLAKILVCLLVCVLSTPVQASVDLGQIPAYTQAAYTIVEEDRPAFTKEELRPVSRKEFSELDDLGRVQTAFAVIGLDSMPTKKRGSIGMIKPTGWHLVKYDNVDGKYLYNRCHLIGYQLSGENANRRNLMIGTRYMNVEGMLPFENQIADFVEATEYHVAYRVIPIFEGDDLLARGVEMEARSIEDDGSGLSFYVYCYNVQPGISIDYANGDSALEAQPIEKEEQSVSASYIINTNTHVFHEPTCRSVSMMAEKNKEVYDGSREALIEQGLRPCQNCQP